ncbi:hypothetical protein Ddye_015256 [Dipteronia dyeriana]|uniref:25S rRNA (uridine-N(3))-methyltransferase BMT5-like domain-containing protein n=1 Tax=Dipteronia dyeriana TaxID=168575 RepID=A0AAD9U4J6_9ROSI|nr:hypothetical protein Ddye_015256 [Dipteronia dyeriana]
MTITRRREVRWIKHYNNRQKILLVGEGDFSFSSCLASAFGSATNMVATCLHSKDVQSTKHWTSIPHLKLLEREGCMVLHEVDVHNMNHHPTLYYMKFDVIIFNFPHAGHYDSLCERDDELIGMHKALIEGFFKSARKMLNENGEVHVTNKDDFPYDRWKLKKLARKSGLILKEKVEFKKQDFPGYHNKRGGDINGNKTFPLNECFTFKFSLPEKSAEIYDCVSDNQVKKLTAAFRRVHLNNYHCFSNWHHDGWGGLDGWD